MSQATTLQPKTKTTAYYIKSLIGILIMVFFRYIPAPDPITPVGMAVLGMFIGLVFLWTFVDMVWPTFVGIILFAFIAYDVYPASTAQYGLYEAFSQAMGSFLVMNLLGLFLLCELLNEVGTIRRIALWFITTKTAKKSPWSFTFMYFLAVFVLGLFLNVTTALLLLLALTKEIFAIAKMTPEDRWTKAITIGTTFLLIITFASTPFCHDMPILFMGIYSGIAGVDVNWLAYIGICVPIAIVLFLLLVVFMRYVVRPDVSKLRSIDFDAINALRPGPMKRKEKFVVVTVICLFIVWIVPGFLSVLAPSAAITQWFNSITMAMPLLAAIVLFGIVHIEGKPVMDIGATAGKLKWGVIFFLAGIMMIGNAMGASTTGISAWISQEMTPLVSGLSPYAFVTLLCAASIILTNIANNVPVGIVFITVGVPLSIQMGINPYVTAVAIAFGANLAYCIPPAFVPIGICYADPYGGGKYTFRWGVVTTIASIAVCAVLLYPLSVLFT